jgi:hypothetical protein
MRIDWRHVVVTAVASTLCWVVVRSVVLAPMLGFGLVSLREVLLPSDDWRDDLVSNSMGAVIAFVLLLVLLKGG